MLTISGATKNLHKKDKPIISNSISFSLIEKYELIINTERDDENSYFFAIRKRMRVEKSISYSAWIFPADFDGFPCVE